MIIHILNLSSKIISGLVYITKKIYYGHLLITKNSNLNIYYNEVTISMTVVML